MKRSVLFRADANPSIGIGDLMSLIHLSHYFNADGWDCHFIVKDYPAGIKLLETYSVDNAQIISATVSIAEEVHYINSYAEKNGIDLLFFEITEQPLSNYEGFSGNVAKACVTFDNQIPDGLDLVVAWDVTAERLFCPEKQSPTMFLLGPEYVILPFNFFQTPSAMRHFRSSPKTCLVCMGGADDLNFTQKVIDTFIEDKYNLQTHIVLGAGYDHLEALNKRLAEARFPYTIIQHATNMLELYTGCDVAVCAGGLTAFEIIATRTRASVIATYRHQIDRCRYFHAKGSITYLGYRGFDPSALMQSVRSPKTPGLDVPVNTWKIVEASNDLFR